MLNILGRTSEGRRILRIAAFGRSGVVLLRLTRLRIPQPTPSYPSFPV